jgi:ATP-dependent DNA helicase RecQ
VLRGRMTDKVAQFAHDKLPTFGVGAELSDAAWRGVARQLVAMGALDVAVENHGELVPTEATRPILKGERKVMLREDLASSRPAPRERVGRAPVPSGDALFEALRAWRRTEAQRQGLPAYMIFSDATLAAITEAKPVDEGDLAEIPGVGRSKLERYGDDVLRIVLENG